MTTGAPDIVRAFLAATSLEGLHIALEKYQARLATLQDDIAQGGSMRDADALAQICISIQNEITRRESQNV